MSLVQVSHDTTASPQSCWKLLGDFAHIDLFNTNLSKSYLLNPDQPIGVGTKRQCDVKDGKNFLREEIVEWREGEYYVIDIYESSFPMDRQSTKFGLLPISGGGTRIYMNFDYKVSFGPIGALMNVLKLRNMLNKGLQNVVEGLGQKALDSETMSRNAA